MAHSNFDLILSFFSCGGTAISYDKSDTLKYNCTNDDKEETFSIQSFRYFGFGQGAKVYFHCDLRVCLSNLSPSSACECPSNGTCYTATRKRRSVGEFVEEVHVRAGPYFVENDEKEEGTIEFIT